MKQTYQQLENLCNSLHDEVSELHEALARSEYNEVMLTRTIRVLKDHAVKDFDINKLKVDNLQNKLDMRVYQ